MTVCTMRFTGQRRERSSVSVVDPVTMRPSLAPHPRRPAA
jgi:hypothetical protein